jgi:hypothetical protein
MFDKKVAITVYEKVKLVMEDQLMHEDPEYRHGMCIEVISAIWNHNAEKKARELYADYTKYLCKNAPFSVKLRLALIGEVGVVSRCGVYWWSRSDGGMRKRIKFLRKLIKKLQEE